MNVFNFYPRGYYKANSISKLDCSRLWPFIHIRITYLTDAGKPLLTSYNRSRGFIHNRGVKHSNIKLLEKTKRKLN